MNIPDAEKQLVDGLLQLRNEAQETSNRATEFRKHARKLADQARAYHLTSGHVPAAGDGVEAAAIRHAREAARIEQQAAAVVDVLSPDADRTLANRRLHYQEAGQWARHYSTVRMTVGTFVITVCATILALKGRGGQADQIAVAVTLLWLAGQAIFFIFTAQTFDRLNSQLRRRWQLPDFIDAPEPARPVTMLRDAASWIMMGLTILLGVFMGLWGDQALLATLLVAEAVVALGLMWSNGEKTVRKWDCPTELGKT